MVSLLYISEPNSFRRCFSIYHHQFCSTHCEAYQQNIIIGCNDLPFILQGGLDSNMFVYLMEVLGGAVLPFQ